MFSNASVQTGAACEQGYRIVLQKRYDAEKPAVDAAVQTSVEVVRQCPPVCVKETVEQEDFMIPPQKNAPRKQGGFKFGTKKPEAPISAKQEIAPKAELKPPAAAPIIPPAHQRPTVSMFSMMSQRPMDREEMQKIAEPKKKAFGKKAAGVEGQDQAPAMQRTLPPPPPAGLPPPPQQVYRPAPAVAAPPSTFSFSKPQAQQPAMAAPSSAFSFGQPQAAPPGFGFMQQPQAPQPPPPQQVNFAYQPEQEMPPHYVGFMFEQNPNRYAQDYDVPQCIKDAPMPDDDMDDLLLLYDQQAPAPLEPVSDERADAALAEKQAPRSIISSTPGDDFSMPDIWFVPWEDAQEDSIVTLSGTSLSEQTSQPRVAKKPTPDIDMEKFETAIQALLSNYFKHNFATPKQAIMYYKDMQRTGARRVSLNFKELGFQFGLDATQAYRKFEKMKEQFTDAYSAQEIAVIKEKTVEAWRQSRATSPRQRAWEVRRAVEKLLELDTSIHKNVKQAHNAIQYQIKLLQKDA